MYVKPQNNSDRRYNSIDLAKGVCILFVVVTHYAWKGAERLKYLFPFWIGMAVPVFMVISGYVYTKSFRKNQIFSLGSAYSIDNILGKIIRYSVPFAMAFFVEEAAVFLSGGHHSIGRIVTTFLRGGAGPGSYYYPLMIQFIFFFPVIFMIIRKYDFKGLVLCGVINFIYEVLKYVYRMNVECYRLLLFRYTLLIAYGCYLAMGNYVRHKKLSVLCLAVGTGYIVATRYMGYSPPITNFWTQTSIWACLFIIPLLGPLIINNASNRVLETVGKASYDIFLVQMVYYYKASGFVYAHVEARALQLLINFVVCVSVGLLFHYVETPITKLIHKWAYDLLCRYRMNTPRTAEE